MRTPAPLEAILLKTGCQDHQEFSSEYFQNEDRHHLCPRFDATIPTAMPNCSTFEAKTPTALPDRQAGKRTYTIQAVTVQVGWPVPEPTPSQNI
jgi:hypothetical protein